MLVIKEPRLRFGWGETRALHARGLGGSPVRERSIRYLVDPSWRFGRHVGEQLTFEQVAVSESSLPAPKVATWNEESRWSNEGKRGVRYLRKMVAR